MTADQAPPSSPSDPTGGGGGFARLITRVRAGDEAAAAELEHTYGPALRRMVRMRMRQRREAGSEDVCQSVMRSFFVRAAAGQFDLQRPEQLLALLRDMAANRLVDLTRRATAQRRDVRREQPLSPGGADESGDGMHPADRGPSPSGVVAWRELLAELLSRLPETERKIAAGRAVGKGWAELAAELGGTPDGLRMKFHRAIEAVAPALGLDRLGE